VGEPVRIVRRFEAPAGPYAAGHRGVDFATVANEAVRAAGSGVIIFAGSVAGRGVVVMRHPDGLRTEYEPIAATVRVGDSVGAGERIGVISGQHDNCPPDGCLHWGARRGSAYFDPLSLLAPLGVVRLVPLAP
jgi:murein DD-endopeptidase MepM/ murein hydrolase activator NlpD